MAVGRTHTHVLIRASLRGLGREVGRLKRHSSHALRAELPGAVWAARCGHRLIRDAEHFASALNYILDHEREGAATWCDHQRQVLRTM